MNQKHPVWLPPDGDVRLVHYQHEVAVAAGFVNGGRLPAHLRLTPGCLEPAGPVSIGSWILYEGEPMLEALDGGQLVGWFCFGLGRSRPWTLRELSDLPPPPPWRWTRGVCARLLVDDPHGDSTFLRWSWERRRGWKCPPTV